MGEARRYDKEANNIKKIVFWIYFKNYGILYLPSFPDGSVVESLPVSAGDTGSIAGWGISPGEGNGNSLQYACLGNPMDILQEGGTLPGPETGFLSYTRK